MKAGILAIGLAVACAAWGAPAQNLKRGAQIPNQYIVVLKEGQARGLLGILPGNLAATAEELTQPLGGKVLYTFGAALNGYLARLTPQQAAQLAQSPSVKYVEQDTVVSQYAEQPVWGLDRVDQRKLPLDERFRPPEAAGKGVSIYIIDTGIRASHLEFKGRMKGGANFAAAGPGPSQGLLGDVLSALDLFNPGAAKREDWDDCNGHGSHVAGTAAGATYGVAREADLYAVRVLGCDGSGTNSGVIAGVDWVTRNAKKPAVANLSLGGGNSTALDEAMRKLIDSGVTAVVAAGNDNKDACNGSPNRVAEAITVGATDRKDQRSSFSNWGRCVDLSAPGSDIASAWFENDRQTHTISGTSMAAPHVAGAAAVHLSSHRQARPAEVAKALITDATGDVLGKLRGSPNRLLFVSVRGEAEPSRPRRAAAEPKPRSAVPQLPLPLGD